MRGIVTLALGIYIGREIFGSAVHKENEKRKNAIWKNVERYVKENNPGMEPEQLRREVESIMQS